MNTSVIRVAVVENPFDPVRSASHTFIEYEENKSFAGYLGEISDHWAASLNGEYLEPEQWHLVVPQENDIIVVSAVPYGHGGGKNILRFVSFVALSYFTMGAGSVFAGMGAMGTALGAGAMIGGSMLINALLPPPTPDVNDNRDIKDSPTYGQDTARNTSESGIPIPLVYGSYRMAGNVIGTYVENINDDQFLYVLYNAGEGEIAGLNNIFINDQPAANFKDVSIETRNGTADQKLIDWFDGVRRQFNVGATLNKEWRTYTFRDAADKASLELTFPRGLYSIHAKKGYKYNASVSFEVEYRRYIPNQLDDVGWRPVKWINDEGDAVSGLYTVTAKNTSTVRRSLKTEQLGENTEFEIRIRRTKVTDSDYINDEAMLATVTEISTERVRYKHTALLALRIKMSEQLSNTPNVTYTNRGIIARVWDVSTSKFVDQTTTNPAWISYDILTNVRYGAGIPEELIRLDRFIEWALWCDDQKLTFDGVLDTASNAFDILEPVLRLGHAKLFTIGTRISVSVEKPDIPVMMFSQANMIKDSFSINWMALADRANEVEVTYFDKLNNYERSVVKVYDDQSIANGDPQRPSSFTLIGCTDESTAFYEALLAINYNKYITQTYTFKASIDAIACTLGSVVYIQHDMPQWGYAGRLLKGNTLNVAMIDIDPSEMASRPDLLMVHHSVLSLGTGKVSKVYDSVIEVDFPLAATRADRITISGRDYAVYDVEVYGSFSRMRLDVGSAAYVGEEVELFATDVFEERSIKNINGGHIEVADPFTVSPDAHSQYMIGRSGSVKKKARIIGIDYSDDHSRQISAIEYNASVYDKNLPFTPSNITSDIAKLGATELSSIDEELIQIGKVIRPRVTISYQNMSSIYQTTQVFISADGGAYERRGTNRRQISFESEDGVKLKIKLVPMDSSGVTHALDAVPVINYTVLGKTAPPADIEGFTITKEVGGIQLAWEANTELDIEGYEIRRGTSWDDGEIITPAISSTILFYPISKAGLYEFMIRSVDTSGNRSSNPAFAKIELVRPERVYNFNAVQHIDKIIMQWDRPLDRNITSFWIREGESWQNSYIHGSVTGTSFEIPATMGGIDRTFWIKAVDIIGIDSEEAVFAKTNIAALPYRNMIYTDYHGKQENGTSFKADGIKLNVAGANPIKLNSGADFGEYMMPIHLPYPTRARTSSGMDVGVSVINSTTWDDATYTWGSPRANARWAGLGDPEQVDFEQFISLKYAADAVDFYPGTEYIFTLNKTLEDEVHNKKPDKESAIEYKPARYNYGAVITPLTNIEWNLTTPESWTASTWLRIPESTSRGVTGVVVSLKVENSYLYLLISEATRSIIVRQMGYQDLIVDNLELNPGAVFFVAVSQQGNERVFRLRDMADTVSRKAVIPVGSSEKLSAVNLGFIALN